VSAILAGRQQKLFLGNLEARRDWGFAPEYVDGMWLMLQQGAPCDLVFGTGETHSVLGCVEEAFGYVNLDRREYVAEDPRYRRPPEVPLLQADPSEAKRRLGWEPGVTFRDLVMIMMDADLEAADLPAPGQGKRAVLFRSISPIQQMASSLCSGPCLSRSTGGDQPPLRAMGADGCVDRGGSFIDSDDLLILCCPWLMLWLAFLEGFPAYKRLSDISEMRL
jgi:hypothetical protein